MMFLVWKMVLHFFFGFCLGFPRVFRVFLLDSFWVFPGFLGFFGWFPLGF